MTQNTVFEKAVFALPMVLLPTFIGVGSFLTLQAPAPVLPALSTEKVITETPKTVERIYLPMKAPIRVTLPEGNRTIKIGLGLAVDADTPKTLSDELLHTPEAIMAGLGDTVLTVRENLGISAPLEQLRRALPPVLANQMNLKLQELGFEPKIQEVLIIEWAVGG